MVEGIFGRPFQEIDEKDLIDLVERRSVREHVHLDYKQRAYPHTHRGTVDMLGDVTALANALGGYIILGVSEDKSKRDGTPDEIVGIDRGDEEATWIQSVCLSSIDEKILGLQVADIPLSSGLDCVAVSVPNSIRKPHMVVHENHRSFRIRQGRSNVPMGMREVREMVISMNAYRASLDQFLDERFLAIGAQAHNDPWLEMMATPIFVDREKIDPLENDFRKVIANPPGKPDLNYEGIRVGQPLPRIYGIEAVPQAIGPDDRYFHMLRLFRNGHLEYGANLRAYTASDWPGQPMPISSYRVTVWLMQFLELAGAVRSAGEISEPYQIGLYFKNIGPAYLFRWKKRPVWMNGPFVWRDADLRISATATDLAKAPLITKTLIDRLFNAFGYDDNPHFDDSASFVKW